MADIQVKQTGYSLDIEIIVSGEDHVAVADAESDRLKAEGFGPSVSHYNGVSWIKYKRNAKDNALRIIVSGEQLKVSEAAALLGITAEGVYARVHKHGELSSELSRPARTKAQRNAHFAKLINATANEFKE